MNRLKAGFTLVELLVVMAIITILAAIAVPNIVNFLNQGQSTRALADISGIETALTEVLADAGRSKLEQLFDSQGVATFMSDPSRTQNWPPVTAEEFRRATLLYSRALTGILRAGRNVLGTSERLDPDDSSLGSFDYNVILEADVVRKLGTSYIDLGLDPWGNLYNIYPGPWSARLPVPDPTSNSFRAPVPFRIFTLSQAQQNLPGSQTIQNDNLVISYDDPEGNDTFPAGFPAPTNEIAFIWSNGGNLVSSQVLYSATGYASGDTAYDGSQDPSFWGGGDDINNWDNGNSWSRFY